MFVRISIYGVNDQEQQDSKNLWQYKKKKVHACNQITDYY